MQMLDPSLEEAARTLGARTGRIIRRIYLPLLGYGILSVVLLNFLALFIAFSIPFVLGASWPQFLSVFIYVNAKDQGNWLAGYTTSVVYICSGTYHRLLLHAGSREGAQACLTVNTAGL